MSAAKNIVATFDHLPVNGNCGSSNGGTFTTVNPAPEAEITTIAKGTEKDLDEALAVVDRIGPGGVLGELALIDQSPRLASAVAEDNVTLQPINRNAFIALVKLDPELGAALLAALAERLHYLTGRLK